jgi:hypothetical protein
MNMKRRGARLALYRSQWTPRGPGVPHGYSSQRYVGSLPADAECVPDALRASLTTDEAETLERVVCAPARAARAAREDDAAKRAIDPLWRLDRAFELLAEAAGLSESRRVPAARLGPIRRVLDKVQVHSSDGPGSGRLHPDVLGEALTAIRAAAAAVRDGAVGSAPSTGARTTRPYALWAQIVEAVEGGGANSLLTALQSRGFVRRKRRQG